MSKSQPKERRGHWLLPRRPRPRRHPQTGRATATLRSPRTTARITRLSRATNQASTTPPAVSTTMSQTPKSVSPPRRMPEQRATGPQSAERYPTGLARGRERGSRILFCRDPSLGRREVSESGSPCDALEEAGSHPFLVCAVYSRCKRSSTTVSQRNAEVSAVASVAFYRTLKDRQLPT